MDIASLGVFVPKQTEEIERHAPHLEANRLLVLRWKRHRLAFTLSVWMRALDGDFTVLVRIGVQDIAANIALEPALETALAAIEVYLALPSPR